MIKDEIKFGSDIKRKPMRVRETDEKNIHAGHRARLIEMIRNAGIDNVSDIQALEAFLTYIFPRGDVNPLAHRLLDKFETFTHVVEASEQELMGVFGINKRAASLITFFGELFYYYSTARMGKKTYITCKAEMLDIVEDHLRFATTENMMLFALSAAGIITQKRRIDLQNSSQVGISIMDLSNFLASAKPFGLVIAHCHPYSSAAPSTEDEKSFKTIKDFCSTCDVELLDSLIVGEDGVFSQNENAMLRKYVDIAELKDAFRGIAET